MTHYYYSDNTETEIIKCKHTTRGKNKKCYENKRNDNNLILNKH